MNDIFVRLIELPPAINAFTVLDSDGNYNVYLNDRLGEEEKKRAYRHELAHILDGHFYRDIPVVECERIAKESERI